jgi:glycosyltransferase involved in cell wall biosynthesis
MTNLSAIIIAKNEEDMLADCIDSLSFCDEIIVIDNKSTDRTAELARHLGAKIFFYTSDNFSDLRNFGLKKAKSKWVLYIDADERVSPELKESIFLAIQKDTSKTVAYRLQRKNYYFNNYEWPYIEKLERLFKKNALEAWIGVVHETPKVKGKIGLLYALPDGKQVFLLHYTHRDLTSMVEKTIEWSNFEATLRFQAGHPTMSWWRFFRVMITAFYRSYVKQQGWRLGIAGLVESMYQSFSMFITYARLWEMQNK